MIFLLEYITVTALFSLGHFQQQAILSMPFYMLKDKNMKERRTMSASPPYQAKRPKHIGIQNHVLQVQQQLLQLMRGVGFNVFSTRIVKCF